MVTAAQPDEYPVFINELLSERAYIYQRGVQRCLDGVRRGGPITADLSSIAVKAILNMLGSSAGRRQIE